MKGHSTSPPCGNLVDGLPHDCHTKTIAKLARLGHPKNGTPPPEFSRVDNGLIGWSNPRKPCRAYVEDAHKCDKI